MSEVAYALFDTPLGACAVAWGPRGVVAVNLPDRHPADLRAGLEKRFPDASANDPPQTVREAMHQIVELLEGKKRRLDKVKLDMTGLSPFQRSVYEAARLIPPGETISYGELARRIGRPGAARAVGHALGRNPFALVVPCHRVLAQGGGMTGFSAPGGVVTKKRLLRLEGAIP